MGAVHVVAERNRKWEICGPSIRQACIGDYRVSKKKCSLGHAGRCGCDYRISLDSRNGARPSFELTDFLSEDEMEVMEVRQDIYESYDCSVEICRYHH